MLPAHRRYLNIYDGCMRCDNASVGPMIHDHLWFEYFHHRELLCTHCISVVLSEQRGYGIRLSDLTDVPWNTTSIRNEVLLQVD